MATFRQARSTRLLVVGLVLASLVTITMDYRGGQTGPLAGLGRLALGVVSPLQVAASNLFRPVSDFIHGVTNIGSLRAENERLRDQVLDTSRQLRDILTLRRENEELKRIIRLGEELELTPIGAEVIGETPSNFDSSLIIDKGADDGVRPDMPVIGPEGLVGRVVRVSGSSAVVLLIIDPESAVGVRLQSSGETGILVGRREHDLRLDLVDRETSVRPGEPVETSGLGGVFPSGIPVGAVSVATVDESSLVKQVLVRPYVDFSRLRIVAVVRPPVIGEGGLGAP